MRDRCKQCIALFECKVNYRAHCLVEGASIPKSGECVTYIKTHEHHRTVNRLGKSARDGCIFCRVLSDSLVERQVLTPLDVSLVSNRSAEQARPKSSASSPSRRLYEVEVSWSLSRENGSESAVPRPHQISIRFDRRKDRRREGNETHGIQISGTDIDKTAICSARSGPAPDLANVAKHVSAWFDVCASEHSCFSSEQHFVPSRLLELDEDESGHITCRLVENVEGGEKHKYLTLSHRWGKDGPSYMLTPETLPHLRTGVSLSALPQTFQDAARLTRMLGFSSLWIDALCIIQGGSLESGIDWRRQVDQMHLVYANGHLNIAACDAVDSRTGFWTPGLRSKTLASPTMPVTVSGILLDGSNVQYTDVVAVSEKTFEYDLFLDAVQDSPLNKRAWVLQERLLAPRVLYLTAKGVFWECGRMTTNVMDATRLEHKDRVVGRESYHRSAARLSTKRAYQHLIINALPTGIREYSLAKRGFVAELDCYYATPTVRSHEMSYMMDCWKQMLKHYFGCGITRVEDRLPAIAGLTAVVEANCNLQCVAGLWLHDLHYELLWEVEAPTATCSSLLPAPSWSWASVDGAVKPYPEDESFCKTHWLCTITPNFQAKHPASAQNEYGLRIHGPLFHPGTDAITQTIVTPFGIEEHTALEFDHVDGSRRVDAGTRLMPIVCRLLGSYGGVARIDGLIVADVTGDASGRASRRFVRMGRFSKRLRTVAGCDQLLIDRAAMSWLRAIKQLDVENVEGGFLLV